MGPVNKVSHVFTLSHVAEMLGEDEEWLFEVAEEMDTEDGQLWVVGVGEDGVMAFTDDGIENLKNLIQIHKAARTAALGMEAPAPSRQARRSAGRLTFTQCHHRARRARAHAAIRRSLSYAYSGRAWKEPASALRRRRCDSAYRERVDGVDRGAR